MMIARRLQVGAAIVAFVLLAAFGAGTPIVNIQSAAIPPNPSATMDAYIGILPFIPDHEIGASATFDIEFRVVGEPVFDATP